jgi:flagellar hook protein FlgE
MVNTSLFAGLSGLRAHQSYIDVIGANLANVSTAGYRGSRVTFSDILSFTQRPGSGPNGTFGGQNPMQIGLGATVASIDVDLDQGTFLDTGRPLDVALQGRGFFALTDGTQTFYTRAGAFDIDSNNTLVDLRTGLRVQSTTGGNITVPRNDTLPAQPTSRVTFTGALPATVDGPRAEVLESASAYLEGQAASKTTTGTGPFNASAVGAPLEFLVSVNGGAQQRVTLSPANPAAVTSAEIVAAVQNAFGTNSTQVQASVDGSGAAVIETVRLGSNATIKLDDAPGSIGLLSALGLDSTLQAGSQSAATAATDLANLTSRQIPYQNGDPIQVRGTNPDGTPFSDTFRYGIDVTTVGDLLGAINNLSAGAAGADPTQASTVTIDATSGILRFTSGRTGEATLSLNIGDSTSPARNAWPAFAESQAGTGPDTAQASIDVIDSLGRAHAVSFEFTRTEADPNVWDLVASVDPDDGTVTQSTIGQIQFNTDGSFSVIGGGTNAFQFSFGGNTQDVTVDFGASGSFDGLTLLGDAATVAATDQDGYGPGSLLNAAFDQAGQLIGFYSNGQTQTFDQLRIAVFPNEGGLLRAGNTMFVEGPNSDDAINTTAGAAGAGVVRPGALENSNVDIAEEFVNLIQAQRGFQANSRVITTTDEILAELVNIVR